MNFGGDIDTSKGNSVLVYISILTAKIVNVVLMLNMLISILGDSYDNFLLEKHIIDYREKLDSIIEIQRMLYWKRVKGSKEFILFLVNSFEDKENENWNGKLTYLERKQERNMQDIFYKVNDFGKSNKKLILDIEDRIGDRIGDGIEGKIAMRVENKILEAEGRIVAGVENRISDIEKKISSIETDMKRVIQLLSR